MENQHCVSAFKSKVPFTKHPNLRAILVAQGEPEGERPLRLIRAVNDSIDRAEKDGIKPPEGAYGYFFGESTEGWRYIFAARIFRRC